MINQQFKEYLKSVSWNEAFFINSKEAHETWLEQEDLLTKKFYPNASGGFTLQQMQDAFMAGMEAKGEGGDDFAKHKLEELQPAISEMNGWANFRHYVLEGRLQDAVDFVELHNEYNKSMTLVIALQRKVAELTEVIQNRINEFSKQMVTETIQQKMFFGEQALTFLRKVLTGDEKAIAQAKEFVAKFKV